MPEPDNELMCDEQTRSFALLSGVVAAQHHIVQLALALRGCVQKHIGSEAVNDLIPLLAQAQRAEDIMGPLASELTENYARATLESPLILH